MIRLHNKLLTNLHREAVQKHENLKRDWGEDFYACIKDIAEHPVVLRMKLYPHHGKTNCYQHCLHVAFFPELPVVPFFMQFLGCRLCGPCRKRCTICSSMTGTSHRPKDRESIHGLTHPKTAYKHARKFFYLTT